MLNMSLHASRDRELSPSQGGLLHPGVLGSVRKFSFMVILALSSAPAGSPAPLGRAGQGLKVNSDLQEGAAWMRLLGLRGVSRGWSHWDCIVMVSQGRAFLSSEICGFSLLSAAFQALPALWLPPTQSKPVLCIVSSAHTPHLWQEGC